MSLSCIWKVCACTIWVYITYKHVLFELSWNIYKKQTRIRLTLHCWLCSDTLFWGAYQGWGFLVSLARHTEMHQSHRGSVVASTPRREPGFPELLVWAQGCSPALVSNVQPGRHQQGGKAGELERGSWRIASGCWSNTQGADTLMLHLEVCCCFTQNYTIIRIATVQHELHQLRRKLGDTKMRLLIEIKVLCLLIRTVKMWQCIEKIRTSQLLDDVDIC